MNNKTTYYQKYKEKLLNRAKKIIRNIKKKVCESKQKQMMMMMMNCFCGMVDRRKTFSLISSVEHCQRSSPSRISDTPRTIFEPAQNLSLGFVE